MATPSSDSEARAIRRRWINLGEIVGVLALLISALTLWNSYSERRHSEDETARSAAETGKAEATLRLVATRADKDRRLDLAPARSDQLIESQTIRFPSALDLSPVQTTGDARIEGSWFADGLKKARSAAGLKAEGAGDLRLPVLIASRFQTGGADARETTSLYWLGYRIEGGLFGSTVRLRGLSRIGPGGSDAQPQLDRLWAASLPPR